MIIPSCLNLEPRQLEKLKRWEETQRKMTIEQHDEMYGGACMTSSCYFQIRESSIATLIIVVNEFTKQICDLTIDDDNELAP